MLHSLCLILVPLQVVVVPPAPSTSRTVGAVIQAPTQVPTGTSAVPVVVPVGATASTQVNTPPLQPTGTVAAVPAIPPGTVAATTAVVPTTPVVPAQPAGPVIEARPGRGVRIATQDGSYAIGIKARIQLRDTIGVAGTTLTNELAVRALRLSIWGSVLLPTIGYNIQLALAPSEFEAGNASPIFDAWMEYTALRDLRIRIGQFFVPFDRFRTVRESSLQLVDRPQVIRELNLDRDIGVMFSSEDLFGTHGKLGYQVFLGSGEGKNRLGTEPPGPLFTARVFVRPMGAFVDDQEGDLDREARPRLLIGLGFGYNHQTHRVGSTTGTTLSLGQ